MRKLTTILAADVAGYSRMMGDDRVRSRSYKAHRARVTKGVTDPWRARRQLVGRRADRRLSASCVEAVRAGMAIQAELKGANAGLPETRRMEFRIGVNLGDVFVEEEDLLGEGVNIAARLQALCEPGGVYISGTVFDQVRTKLGTEFVFLGERQVKNIVDPVAIYAIAFEGARKRSRATRCAGAAAASPISSARPGIGRRALACAIDLIIAAMLVYLIFAPIEFIFNDIVEVDTPFFNLAQERVIQSQRIRDPACRRRRHRHGREHHRAQRSLGLNKHFYRETEREFRKPGGTAYEKVDGPRTARWSTDDACSRSSGEGDAVLPRRLSRLHLDPRGPPARRRARQARHGDCGAR